MTRRLLASIASPTIALMFALFSPIPTEAQNARIRSPVLVKIRVRAGETVATLAERFNVAAEEIVRLNNVNPDAELQPGAEVLMPSNSSATAPLRRRQLSSSGVNSEVRTRAALYEPLIRAAARRFNVDPRVLWTIAFLETRFRPDQVSPKGAQGMMQFMPDTARTFSLTNPFDPAAAIDAAARYVRFLAERFDNRFELILAGYNAGEGTVEAYRRGISLRLPNGRIINPRRLQTNGVPPYEETRNYVAQGLGIARQIQATGIFNANEFVAFRFTEPSPVMAATATTAGARAGGANDEEESVAPAPASVYASTTLAASPTTSSISSQAASPSQTEERGMGDEAQPAPQQPRSSYVGRLARGGK